MARINMKADASSDEGGDFPVAEAGDYLVKVEKVTDGFTSDQSKNPGTPKVDLLLGIYDEAGEKVGSCFKTLAFIPEGVPGHGMWLHANHALGMPHDGEVDFDTVDYLNRSCYAKVGVGTWKNKPKNEIDDWYLPEGSGEEAPPAEQEAPPADPEPKSKPASRKPAAAASGGRKRRF